MKTLQLKKSIVCFSISLFGLANGTTAANAAVSHEQFTRVVDSSLKWARHLKIEVVKGKKMDRAHAQQEMKSLQESLSEMTKSYQELAKQPASEVAEGHFVAIKQHQNRAESELRIFEAEFGRLNPDFGVLKKAAKKIEAELVEAARAHQAELHELDVR